MLDILDVRENVSDSGVKRLNYVLKRAYLVFLTVIIGSLVRKRSKVYCSLTFQFFEVVDVNSFLAYRFG